MLKNGFPTRDAFTVNFEGLIVLEELVPFKLFLIKAVEYRSDLVSVNFIDFKIPLSGPPARK